MFWFFNSVSSHGKFNSASVSQVNISEQLLNAKLDSDEGEIADNSISVRNAVTSNSDNKFSDGDEDFRS